MEERAYLGNTSPMEVFTGQVIAIITRAAEVNARLDWKKPGSQHRVNIHIGSGSGLYTGNVTVYIHHPNGRGLETLEYFHGADMPDAVPLERILSRLDELLAGEEVCHA